MSLLPLPLVPSPRGYLCEDCLLEPAEGGFPPVTPCTVDAAVTIFKSLLVLKLAVEGGLTGGRRNLADLSLPTGPRTFAPPILAIESVLLRLPCECALDNPDILLVSLTR